MIGNGDLTNLRVSSVGGSLSVPADVDQVRNTRGFKGGGKGGATVAYDNIKRNAMEGRQRANAI
jgi:hypothetical protein